MPVKFFLIAFICGVVSAFGKIIAFIVPEYSDINLADVKKTVE